MDYIRQEQLRQLAVLTRLLTGEKTKEQETSPVTAQKSLADTTARLNSEAAFEMVEDGTLTQSALLSAATLPEQSQKARGETTLSVSFPAGGAPWEVGEVNFWAARGDSGMPTDAAAPQADARALSRAIERDARRYDGGFTLY